MHSQNHKEKTKPQYQSIAGNTSTLKLSTDRACNQSRVFQGFFDVKNYECKSSIYKSLGKEYILNRSSDAIVAIFEINSHYGIIME